MARTTAHLLREAISQDSPTSPTDHHTIKHYNLDRATDTNRLLLLGFYRMLFLEVGVRPEELDNWRRQGSMVENLERVLSEHRRQVFLGHNSGLKGAMLGYCFFFQSNRDLFVGTLGEEKPGCVSM